MIKVVLAGVFFGLCAMFLIEMLKVGERLAEKIKVWVPFKGVIGGAALVVLTLIFSTRYLGLGLTTIESCLRGNPDHWYGFIIKPIFTSITLSFGGSGGIVTPIFFVGATAGATLALLFGLNISTFSAIGLVSVLAGAANTPIAASILAVEMFGPAIAPYATIACVISFLMTGHRSVYPSQILSIGKSASIEVELGKEIDDAEIAYKPRERGLVPTALKLMRMIEERVRKHD
jgi:H+/Cl- antiporter ClcA